MAHTKCNKLRIAYSMCTKYKAMDFSDSQIQTHTVRREAMAFARCRRRHRVCVCESEKRVSVCSEYVWHSWPTLIFLSSGRCVCVCRATEETNVCIILWRLLVMISKYNCAYCSAACLHIHESEHQYSHGSEALRYRLKKGRQRRKTWYAHSNHHHIHTEEGTHSPKCNYAICESTVFGGTENRLIRQINVLDVLECSMRTETWSKILQTQSKQSYTLSRAATGLNFCWFKGETCFIFTAEVEVHSESQHPKAFARVRACVYRSPMKLGTWTRGKSWINGTNDPRFHRINTNSHTTITSHIAES